MFGGKTIPLMMVSGIFLLFSVVVYPSSLEAQHRGGHGSRDSRAEVYQGLREKKQEEKYFEKLCDYLELDKKQKKAARKLFKKMQKETEKIAKDILKGKLTQYEASERRIKMYKDYRDKFRALLSEGQQKKYEKLRETGLKTEK